MVQRLRALGACGVLLVTLAGCDRIQRARVPAVPPPAEVGPLSRTPAVPAPDPAATASDGSITVIRAVTPSEEQSLAVIRTRIAAREEKADPAPRTTPTLTPTALLRALDNNIVTAPALGLMWSREAAGTLSLADARVWCEQLALASHRDWRVPTIDELEAATRAGFVPANTSSLQQLWSVTPHPVRGVWVFDLRAGDRTLRDGGRAHVMCVRRDATAP